MADFVGDCKPSGEHINYRHCPKCGSDEWKVYMSPDTGLWVCFASRHGEPRGGKVDAGQAASAHSQSVELFAALRATDEKTEWPEVDLPPWVPLSKTAKRYLRKRGIDEALARKLGLVEWAEEFRVLFPYFDRAGNLIYWNSRRYSDHAGYGPKYSAAPGKHPLYELRAGMAGPTVLVEGVVDAVKVWQAGYHVLALGGKSLPRYLVNDLLTLTAGSGILVVLLDPDALAQAFRLREQLSDRRRVRIVALPPGKDPGDMTPDELREAISGNHTHGSGAVQPA